jgi:hypothetical protein
VIGFQEQLNGIKADMGDGNFVGPDGTFLKGQEIVRDLLAKCLKWSEIVLERYVFVYTTFWFIVLNVFTARAR